MITELVQPTLEELETEATQRVALISAATNAAEFFLDYTFIDNETGFRRLDRTKEITPALAKKHADDLLKLEQHNFNSEEAFCVSRDEVASYGYYLLAMSLIK